MSPSSDDEKDARIRYLEEKVAEYQIRLDNGIHTFSDMKQDISTRFGEVKQDIGKLEEATKPKPFDWKWAAGFLLGVGGVFATVIISVSSRPTNEKVSEMIAEHHDTQSAADIKQLQTALR
jgi:hypothetical protein